MPSISRPFHVFLLLFAATFILLGSVGCDLVTRDKRLDEIENKLVILEKQIKERDLQEVNRQASLEACAKDAENLYWTWMQANGKVLPDGTIRAALAIWDRAEKIKKAKLDECKLLYGRQ